MRTHRNTLALLSAILIVLLSGCQSGTLSQSSQTPQSQSTKTYTVTFDLNGGTLVQGSLLQEVNEGESAVAPEVENGSMKLSWDRGVSNVTSDMTVTAQWEKVELSAIEIAELVQKSTVTINCTFLNGSSGSGSGFFIDDEGTVVTSYHVIEYANSISVEIANGGKYDVDKIVAFSELYDLAILKIKLSNTPALTICTDGVRVGEIVYANGSALGILQGTFTSGTISSTSRSVCGISCIQMDAAISSGNSGGPLVNSFCEVVGVNAMSYTAGENLNLAVKIENLELLSNEVNYSVNNYTEWIMKESDRSYSPYVDSESFYYSTVNTYTNVTGQKCLYSVDFDGYAWEMYVADCEYYVYDYIGTEEDKYVEYLKSKGFEFYDRETFADGVSYYYYNEWTGVLIDMYQEVDDLLYIWVYYLYY